ncbi:hypothetical protein ACIRRA_10695 [Nocardia sp. NPDC101769]|uniref:hypothetical protein n=1 Tax=Nocardia sp. NPDC101769 TaxID=3364333 RepID=UPI0037FC7208
MMVFAGLAAIAVVGLAVFDAFTPSTGSAEATCGSLTDGQAREQLTRYFNVVVPEQFQLKRMDDHCTGSGYMADPRYEYIGQFTASTSWLDEHPLVMPANYSQRAGTCADTAPWQPIGFDCAFSTSITLFTRVGATTDPCSVLVSRSATSADLYTDCRWGYVG